MAEIARRARRRLVRNAVVNPEEHRAESVPLPPPELPILDLRAPELIPEPPESLKLSMKVKRSPYEEKEVKQKPQPKPIPEPKPKPEKRIKPKEVNPFKPLPGSRTISRVRTVPATIRALGKPRKPILPYYDIADDLYLMSLVKKTPKP